MAYVITAISPTPITKMTLSCYPSCKRKKSKLKADTKPLDLTDKQIKSLQKQIMPYKTVKKLLKNIK